MNGTEQTSTSKWTETVLGNIADIQTGPFGSQLHESDYVPEGTPIITVENLVNDYISHLDKTPNVSVEDTKRLSRLYSLKEGDIVFSRVGSVDRSAYVSSNEEGWLFSGRLLRVRPNEDVSGKWLHYWIRQESIKNYVRKVAVGATMPSINTSLLSGVPVVVPSNEDQEDIAGVLSVFDEKIRLLQEQNKTLEEMAQVLFKHWFVDFEFLNNEGKPYKSSGGKMVESELGEVPAGWTVGVIGDFVEIKGGSTPSTKELSFWNGDIHWTSPKDLSNNKGDIFLFDTEKKVTEEGLKQISSGLLPEGTLLMSSRAPVGYLAISQVPISINQGYIAFKPGGYLDNYFMYLWLKKNMRAIKNVSGGSTFEEVSKSSFRNIPCVVPPKDVLESFSTMVIKCFDKVSVNTRQIQTLSQLRDTLLPKLMTGAVRVK